MDKRLLTNAELKNMRDSWYAPADHLKSFSSVKHTSLWNTSSSAGDWDGYFIQSLNNTNYLISFSQENNYPRGGGFTLYTGEVLASWKGKLTETKEQIQEIYMQWLTDNGY
jgi:hypothetical protein